MSKNLAFVFLIASIGCGGSAEEAQHEEHAGGEHDAHHEHGSHEHHDEHAEHHDGHDGHHGPPQILVAYHDVLAPAWHSDPGEVRANNACTAAADMIAQGEALAAAPAPNDNPAWATEVATLGENGQALSATCADETATVEAKEASFDTLHNTFHRLMEIAR